MRPADESTLGRTAPDDAPAPDGTPPQGLRALASRGPVRWGAAAVGLAVLAYGLAAGLPAYWVFLAMSAVISGVLLQSLGVVAGQAGMVSLCQMAFAAIGAWTTAQLNVWGVPGGLYVWLPLAGLAAVPFGLLIGLPALRLRGVHLAIITLGFAATVDIVMAANSFPGVSQGIVVGRPAGLGSDRQFFLFCCGVFALVGVALALVRRTRLGASWRALRESERATAAAGTSVPGAKLSAFAVSAFIAGTSGALLAGQLAMVVSRNFDPGQSLVAYAVAIMAGAHHAEGALIGGALGVLVAELLRRLGVPQQWANVVFAVGAVQAMTQGSGMSDGLRAVLRRRRRTRSGPGSPAVTPPAALEPAVPPPGGPDALRISGVSVRYGRVVAVDDVTLTVPAGAVHGLVGPNGAGKSSLVDAISGFVPAGGGTVEVGGVNVAGLAVHRRSRAGLRRTFQQDRVPVGLTVREYLRFAARRPLGDAELAEGLAGLVAVAPGDPIAALDVGTRRLLEVAGTLLARPAVAVLDEPAAGLGHSESERLGAWLREVPTRYGAAVLLIEHDLDLVRTACSGVTVLDFGEVIAEGPPAEVFAEPRVLRAYLGEEPTT
ncbi:ATP-binding cassette domain-containing protein [Spongiactinospora sp. TRM90649]|uniref:branched-chain amino acid ABC transporter ATP-binding protein/permease n=1 Tax=Spongiactinospora sp. TRM90649 TaxID=3031114 RepID=UPI0023FA37B0|nr:ATP-binding cassette domain-containing protein [Spongiactinospora sp. TRM90649]MDF5758874.1 ATP-binding cassette domain-containing protein [Spongiactinospora sp. TRM90649]